VGTHRGLTRRTFDLVEDAEWIAKTGGTWDEACRRLNISDDGLRRALKRAQRDDIAQRFNTNRPGWVDYLPGGMLPQHYQRHTKRLSTR